MRKFVAIVLSIFALASALAGCHHPNTPNVTSHLDYTLLLEDNLLVDPFTERVGDRILRNERVEVNGEVPNKTVTLFGETHTFVYQDTSKSTASLHNKVSYKAEYDETNDFYFASFDSVTGSLMSYTSGSAGKDRSYQSEVNEKSSEAEFLAYAKKLVSQHHSVEGCQVEITSEIFEYDEMSGNYYPRKHVAGYVNNTENAPDFYAVYHVTFYKTIDGIRRYDTNVIEINNTGEVHRLWFDMQDELYADFNGIEIDLEQAERLTREALAKFISADSAEITPSLVATNDGVLWLQLQVYVRFDNGAGGVNIYVIEIATVNKD